MNPSNATLDLWEQELKLSARMTEMETIRSIIVGKGGSHETLIRMALQRREQDMLRELEYVRARLKTAMEGA